MSQTSELPEGLPDGLPERLPVLPLRDTVTYPDTLTPLAVGQERSIQLVNDVLSGDRMLVMLGSKDPDIWITMLAGTQCTQIVNEIAQNGMKEKLKYAFMPQTCPGAQFISKEKLGGDGMAGDGWWILSPGLKDMRDAAFDNDPYVTWLKTEMKARGLDPQSSSNLSGGINYGFPVVQSLIVAGQLPGGVTRSNFQLAIRAFDITSPMLLPGIRAHMDGLKDAYIVEGGVFQKWDATKQTWVSQGNVIDLDGKAKLCTWDQTAATCK